MKSVRVQWLNHPHSLMFFQLDADFTIEDYREAVKEAWTLLDNHLAEKFYVVADVSAVNRIPTTMITTMFKAYGKTHPSFAGLTIFIGAPRFIQRLVDQFQNIFHTSKFGFANDFVDLDSVIAQHLQHH